MGNYLFLVSFFLLCILVEVTIAYDVTASFNGSQYVQYKIKNIHATRKDKVAFMFKTIEAFGVMMYGCGEQGDFILLELKRGKVV